MNSVQESFAEGVFSKPIRLALQFEAHKGNEPRLANRNPEIYAAKVCVGMSESG
jgi:hypothetical protein